MAIRQVVAGIIVLYTILFLVAVLWLPSILIIQPLLSILIFVLLYFWIAQLEEDLDKKTES